MQQSSGGGGMLSGIGSTIVQGMAFGTGSAIAHRAVGAVAGGFGGSSDAAPQQAAASAPEYAQGAMPSQAQDNGACAMDKQMFYECLGQNKGDQQACNFLYEQLKTCQSGQSPTTFY
jgi:coiled-coil-helix-coiled-coil-helix domain-containing protein 10